MGPPVENCKLGIWGKEVLNCEWVDLCVCDHGPV